MPYKAMKDVNPAIKGVKPPVTLAQANSIARCADKVKDVKSPWAVCIANFKKSHRVEGGRWVKKEADATQMGLLIPIADFADKVDASGIIKGIEVWYAGLFKDKHGKMVDVTDADLDEYEANFRAGVVGQELPIYVGHPPLAIRAEEPAAAWIKDMYTKIVGGVKKLLWDIDLTALGKKVLSEKLYKYLSPSIRLDENVITGGGFCTMPAIKGNRPIEYAFSEYQFLQEAKPMSIFEQVKQAMRELFTLEPEFLAEFSQENIDTGGDQEMTEQERLELEAKIRGEIEAEFAAKAQTVADLTESITEEVRAKVEAEFTEKVKREAELTEFVQEVCEAGLSTPPDEVTAALMLLGEEQLKAIQPLLKAKIVDFSERGHTGAGQEVKQLPKEMKSALQKFIQDEESVTDAVATFCEANKLDMQEYDLTEFLPKQ